MTRTREEEVAEISRLTTALTQTIQAPEAPGKIDFKLAIIAMASLTCNMSLMTTGGDVEAAREFLHGLVDMAIKDAEEGGIPEAIRKGGPAYGLQVA